MASTMEDDEAWLYGDTNPDDNPADKEVSQDENSNKEVPEDDDSLLPKKTGGNSEPLSSLEPEDSVRIEDREAGELSGEEVGGTGQEGTDDSDSDDDDVQVTIGDIKASPTYGYGGAPVNLNIKRGGTYLGSTSQTTAIGKGKGIDLDAVGSINGVPAYEFNLDSMEDKPWRKPGADITDYFNYGFNEETWKAYCDKQRKLRMEGSTPLAKVVVHHVAKDQQIPVAAVNENSKYAGSSTKKAGPPPGRKLAGAIDVIGGTTTTSRRPLMSSPKENVIQVMTADKRDYSRKAFPENQILPPPTSSTPSHAAHIAPPGFIPPDLSVPPPGLPPPPPGIPPPGLPPPGLPPPPASMIPAYSDHFGGYGRFPVPPPAVAPPSDRPQPPGFDNHSPFYGGNSQNSYPPFESPGDVQWEHRDRPGSSFSQSWEYGHDRSSERSPQRGEEGHEEEHERRHNERHRERERERERSRDKDRERDRDRDRERDRDRSERSHDRERDRSRDRDRERDRDRDRERDREYEYDDRNRDRDRDRERDRDRRHRDRDRERDKEHRSSRRKHREEEESEHRSSRHKRKRSKRDKEDEGTEAQEAVPAETPTTAPTVEDEKRE